MKRPGEPNPATPELGPDTPKPPDQKKRRRKDEEPEHPEAAEEVAEAPPEPEGPELDEQARRAIAAEAAFRERVAVQELADRLPEQSYREVVDALDRIPGRWRVERGRHVFSRLVGERELTIDATPVKVEHRIRLLRSEEPPAEPDVLERKLAELFDATVAPEEAAERLEPLQSELADGDEVRIEVPERDPIVVTSDAVRVERAADPEPTPVPLPDPSTVERAVREVLSEPLEPIEPAAEASTPLGRAASVLEREAVDLNELPVIAGGAPEADEPEPPDGPGADEEFFPEELALPPEEEVPVEQEQPPEQLLPAAPAPERRRPNRPRRRRKLPEVITWEPGWPEAIHGPDAALRKKARKLIRRLAAEYHVQLTPDLEAYLLAILLRPGVVNGRKVYSLGFNVETAIRIMNVLATGGFARPHS